MVMTQVSIRGIGFTTYRPFNDGVASGAARAGGDQRAPGGWIVGTTHKHAGHEDRLSPNSSAWWDRLRNLCGIFTSKGFT